MKIKKMSAVFALLSMGCMLLHMGFSVFCYVTMYYNPFLKYVFAVPFTVLTCLHAVCGMISVFTQAEGTRMDLYPKQNLRTLLQRISAALIFPLLILHIKTFDLLRASAEGGNTAFVLLLLAAQIMFYAVVIIHVAVSLTRAFITLGILISSEKQKKLDRLIYAVLSVAFIIASVAVTRGQLMMFM